MNERTPRTPLPCPRMQGINATQCSSSNGRQQRNREKKFFQLQKVKGVTNDCMAITEREREREREREGERERERERKSISSFLSHISL